MLLSIIIQMTILRMYIFQVNLMAAVANWEHNNDADGQFKDYTTGEATITYNYALEGLKIGDAPQTQAALGASFFPIQGMTADLTYRYYLNHYSQWDPTDREYDKAGGEDRKRV